MAAPGGRRRGDPARRRPGRIPNFVGADAAAQRLAQTPAWQAAAVIKCNPDWAQQPVRARALADGKLVYMAVPRLAGERPFYRLDPAELPARPQDAADRQIAAQVGVPVGLGEMRPVDLVVCGSVAVNRQGARLGKGAGFSDIEVALLHEEGLQGAGTVIVTTVHALQVIDVPIPETAHDFRVNLIVTDREVIACPPARPLSGIAWEQLDEGKIAAIPVLAARARAARR